LRMSWDNWIPKHLFLKRHIENPRQLVWHSVRQFRKTVWPKENLSDRIKT
jgi:hypothetical protein